MKFLEDLRSLLTSRYTQSLETRIEELKADRDYFRGRAERLEMIVLGRIATPQPQIHGRESNFPRGRKSMAELQRELTQQEREQELAAKAKEN